MTTTALTTTANTPAEQPLLREGRPVGRAGLPPQEQAKLAVAHLRLGVQSLPKTGAKTRIG